VIGRRNNHAGEDYRTVQRVRTALEGYAAEHGPGVQVNVAHVLDLLDPRGAWRLDPERVKAARQRQSADVDPWTGCAPVTAQGEAPQ
jgi:hypothetical protein